MNNTEETLDFKQKHKEDLQRLRGFRLLDDDFMSKVFEDKACAEFLLQIILQRHDLKMCKLWCKFIQCVSSCCLYNFFHFNHLSLF